MDAVVDQPLINFYRVTRGLASILKWLVILITCYLLLWAVSTGNPGIMLVTAVAAACCGVIIWAFNWYAKNATKIIKAADGGQNPQTWAEYVQNQ